MNEIDNLSTQIDDLMKKYKMSMYGIVACIIVYLVCLFFVKIPWLVLVICIPMVVLAVINNKYAKQIRKLAEKRAVLQKQEQERTEAIEKVEGMEGEENLSEPILANAESLNELPKEYTVLDDVVLDGKKLEHVIASPYGIAIVAQEPAKEEMEVVLQEAGCDDAQIFEYEPGENIAELAQAIQMPKTVCMTEQQIMKVLQKLAGIS